MACIAMTHVNQEEQWQMLCDWDLSSSALNRPCGGMHILSILSSLSSMQLLRESEDASLTLPLCTGDEEYDGFTVRHGRRHRSPEEYKARLQVYRDNQERLQQLNASAASHQ